MWVLNISPLSLSPCIGCRLIWWPQLSRIHFQDHLAVGSSVPHHWGGAAEATHYLPVVSSVSLPFASFHGIAPDMAPVFLQWQRDESRVLLWYITVIIWYYSKLLIWAQTHRKGIRQGKNTRKDGSQRMLPHPEPLPRQASCGLPPHQSTGKPTSQQFWL